MLLSFKWHFLRLDGEQNLDFSKFCSKKGLYTSVVVYNPFFELLLSLHNPVLFILLDDLFRDYDLGNSQVHGPFLNEAKGLWLAHI